MWIWHLGVGAGLERGRQWREGRAQHAERGGAAIAAGSQGVLRRQTQAREKATAQVPGDRGVRNWLWRAECLGGGPWLPSLVGQRREG